MVEVLIAITVLSVGLGAVTTSMVMSNALNQSNRETTLALNGALSAVESVRGTAYADAFATFNANPADDPLPGGAGTAPGNFFAIPGLGVRDGDPDGFVGEIVFPGDGVGLFENVVDRDLGLPRDLNGDGDVDANAIDHSTDYTVLPVRVRLEWTGKSGNRQLEFVTTLVDQ